MTTGTYDVPRLPQVLDVDVVFVWTGGSLAMRRSSDGARILVRDRRKQTSSSHLRPLKRTL